jgi:hypothetical protein
VTVVSCLRSGVRGTLWSTGDEDAPVEGSVESRRARLRRRKVGRETAALRHQGGPTKGFIEMGPWLLLLILALIAFVLGFATAAKWLFIIAVVLLVIGLFWSFAGRRSTL